MPLYEPVFPARYVKPLLEIAAPLGQTWLDDAVAGLDLGADAVLTMTAFDRLLAQVSAAMQRHDLGFDMGLRINVDSHSALSLALRHCATLDHLLRMAARYGRLINPSHTMLYRRHPDHGELTVRPAAGMSQATLRTFEELYAVAMHSDYAQLLGPGKQLDIYLSMPEPAHRRRYSALKPTRFHFAANALPELRVAIPAEMLDLALPHQPRAPAASSQQLQAMMDGVAKTWCLSEWIVLMLREAEGCQPGRRELAELLNVSPTTLTRKLAREGHHLRGLGNAVRHQRACAMLLDSKQSVSQIAYRLGYSDVANFSLAFRATCGMSPRAFRQRG